MQNIPGYRIDWRRVVTTHTRVGVNSLWPQHKVQIYPVLYVAIYLIKPFFFQSRFSLLIINFLNLTLSELTSTLTYMQANTNAHKTHAHTHRQTYTHTLPDLAYKKMCVCEQRKFVGGADTHTPSRSSAGCKSCDVHNLKQQETRIVSPCQTATVLREFIVSYFNNATLFHSNSDFFFKKQ